MGAGQFWTILGLRQLLVYSFIRLMLMSRIDWFRFANGGVSNPVRICRLAPNLVRALGADDDRVLLHPHYAPKLVFKHKMRSDHLPLLALSAELGTVVQNKPGTLSFFYDDTVVFGKLFHMALKTTTERHEIWVCTFHPIRNTEYTRRIKNRKLIRVQT